MLKILLYFVILLAEIGICIFAVSRRVNNGRRFIYESIAALAILAFFITVTIISLPECTFSLFSIVCPAK